MKLPNWEELLRHFASKVYPGNPLALEIFTHRAAGKGWPAVSSLIETEFNQIWLTSPDYSAQRKAQEASVKAGASLFKLELATFFKAAEKSTDNPHLLDELSASPTSQNGASPVSSPPITICSRKKSSRARKLYKLVTTNEPVDRFQIL